MWRGWFFRLEEVAHALAEFVLWPVVYWSFPDDVVTFADEEMEML